MDNSKEQPMDWIDITKTSTLPPAGKYKIKMRKQKTDTIFEINIPEFKNIEREKLFRSRYKCYSEIK